MHILLYCNFNHPWSMFSLQKYLVMIQVSLLGRLHHRNLVNLVGYCVDKGQHMLIYEFMSNGSLANLLYGKLRTLFNIHIKISYIHGNCLLEGICSLWGESGSRINLKLWWVLSVMKRLSSFSFLDNSVKVIKFNGRVYEHYMFFGNFTTICMICRYLFYLCKLADD